MRHVKWARLYFHKGPRWMVSNTGIPKYFVINNRTPSTSNKKKSKIIKYQSETVRLKKQYQNKLLMGMKTIVLFKMQINFVVIKTVCSSR